MKSPTAADWTFLTTPAAAVQIVAPTGNLTGITLTAPPSAPGTVRKYLRLRASLTN